MDKNKKYIFQLSESDIAEISDVTNMIQGEGITFIKNENGIEISIDKQSLKKWIEAVMSGVEID